MSLFKTNKYLQDKENYKKMLIKSVASSTAIETNQSIEKIEIFLLNKELLPCPFCGGKPRLISKGDEPFEEYWDIECGTKDCYLEDGADWWDDKYEIVKKWNTRK